MAKTKGPDKKDFKKKAVDSKTKKTLGKKKTPLPVKKVVKKKQAEAKNRVTTKKDDHSKKHQAKKPVVKKKKETEQKAIKTKGKESENNDSKNSPFKEDAVMTSTSRVTRRSLSNISERSSQEEHDHRSMSAASVTKVDVKKKPAKTTANDKYSKVSKKELKAEITVKAEKKPVKEVKKSAVSTSVKKEVKKKVTKKTDLKKKMTHAKKDKKVKVTKDIKKEESSSSSLESESDDDDDDEKKLPKITKKKALRGRQVKAIAAAPSVTLAKTSRLASLNAKCKVQMMYENEKGDASNSVENSPLPANETVKTVSSEVKKTSDKKTTQPKEDPKKKPVNQKTVSEAKKTVPSKKTTSQAKKTPLKGDSESEDDESDDETSKPSNKSSKTNKVVKKNKAAKKKTSKGKGIKRKRADDDILASSLDLDTRMSKRVASLNASAIMAASFLPEEASLSSPTTKSNLKATVSNAVAKVDKKSVSFTSPASVESLPSSPKDMQVIQRIHSSSHVEILNPVHPTVVAGRVVVSQNQSIEMVKQVRKVSSSKDKSTSSKDKASEHRHPLLKLKDIDIPGKSKSSSKSSKNKSSSSSKTTVTTTPVSSDKAARTSPTDHQVSTILEKDFSVSSSSQKYSTLIQSNSSHTTQSYSLSLQNSTPLDQHAVHGMPIVPIVPAAASTFTPAQQLALTTGMPGPFGSVPQFPVVHPLALNAGYFMQQQQQQFYQQQQQNYNQQMKYHHPFAAKNYQVPQAQQQPMSVVSVQSVNPFNLPLAAHQSSTFPMTHFGSPFNFGQIPVTAHQHQQQFAQQPHHHPMAPTSAYPMQQLVHASPQHQGGQFYHHTHPVLSNPMMQDNSSQLLMQQQHHQQMQFPMHQPQQHVSNAFYSQGSQGNPLLYPCQASQAYPGAQSTYPSSSHLNEAVPATQSLTGKEEDQSQAALIASHQLTIEPMQLSKKLVTAGGRDLNATNISSNNINLDTNTLSHEEQHQTLHKPKAFHANHSTNHAVSRASNPFGSSSSAAASVTSSSASNSSLPVDSTISSLTKDNPLSASSVATPTMSVQKQSGHHHLQRQQPPLSGHQTTVPSSKVTPCKRVPSTHKTLPVTPQTTAGPSSTSVGKTGSNQRPGTSKNSKTKQTHSSRSASHIPGHPLVGEVLHSKNKLSTTSIPPKVEETQQQTSNRFHHRHHEIIAANLLQVPCHTSSQSKTPTIATVRPQITTTTAVAKQAGILSPPKPPEVSSMTLPLSPTTTRRNSPSLQRRRDPQVGPVVVVTSSSETPIVSTTTIPVQLQVSETRALTTVSALQSTQRTSPSLQSKTIVTEQRPTLTGGHIPVLSLTSASLSCHATPLVRKQPAKRKFAHGWSWTGKGFLKHVYINGEGGSSALRTCYPSMRHTEGDIIRSGDSVLLRSGPRKTDLPFVAKITSLWEAPDGEMMMSLLWYYRPEHTEQGRTLKNMPEELFASKHRDVNSVATIDDKCFVLTFSEYCRFKKQVVMFKRGISSSESSDSLVPSLKTTYFRKNRLPAVDTLPDMIFCCRRVYDFRQKRILKNPM